MAKRTKKIERLSALGRDITTTASDLSDELTRLQVRCDTLSECVGAASKVRELIDVQLQQARGDGHPLLQVPYCTVPLCDRAAQAHLTVYPWYCVSVLTI